MVISTVYDIGQQVYLKTDIDQSKYMILHIMIESGHLVKYFLVSGRYGEWHYEMEISGEINLELMVKNI